jgi:hypothetical protein
MKNPLQMYSKIGDLKIIQIKKEKNNTKSRITYNQILPPNLPLLVKKIPLHPFIGSLNKKLTTGIIISSKINQLRKDGMSFKYFRYNYLLSQDIGKLSKQPLIYEYKLSSSPLLAKKYIKIINGYSFYDFNILNLIG